MNASTHRRERRQRILPFLARLNSSPSSASAAAAAGPTIASYNVHKCVGTDNRFDPDRVAAVIAELDGDIVALQEAAQRFGRRTPLLDLKRLERECGLKPVVQPGAFSTEDDCGWRGNILLLREGAVRDARRIRLPGVEPRGALVVDVELNAGPLRIVAAHLGLLRRSRELQTAAILAAAATEEMPTALLGDLNEWRLGPRSSLRNLHPTFGPLTDALPTFPSRFPLLALDRILVKPHSLISGLEVHDTPLARVASDHLPVKARLNLDVVMAGCSAGDGRIAA